MKKRMLALLLTVLMVLSLLPVSALAAEMGEVIGNDITGGSFTDADAEADKSYTYTIVGSDGSTQTVNVAAVSNDAAGDKTTTAYGTITETTGTGATYYELVTNGAEGITAGNKYLIVNTNTGSGYALTKTAGSTKVTITDEKITTEMSDAEFTVVSNGSDAYFLQDGDGKYLYPASGSIGNQDTLSYTHYPISFTGNSSVIIKSTLYSYYTYYLTYNNRNSKYSGSYNSGTNVYLFEKKTEPSGTVYTVNWNEAAKTLLDECEALKKGEYTADSWTAFAAALAAAQTAYTATGTYTEKTDAEAAIATMTALADAKAALVKNGTVYPEITWQRTKEYSTDYTNKGNLVTGLEFTKPGEDDTYPKVFWNWSDVSGLTTDPSMTVWDYGTDDQYAKVKKEGDSFKTVTANENISAATWVHRDKNGNGNVAWDKIASVRKFAGTFTWPEGYDLDDTAALVSVNDSYYQLIYDYVADSGNETYQKAVEGKYILPVNDDIYVFMYAEGTTLTEENYMDYLVFWTGTSGKGVWSATQLGGNDWAKTTPSTFHDIYANRSFHGVTPNLWSKKADNTDAKSLTIITGWDSTLMNQSDGWYTFADTDGITTVLNKNYDSIKAGTKMHIDIYCFDNDTIGGMDELELKMTRTPETHKTVEVRYYLDKVDDDHYLGDSYMSNVKIGTSVTLQSGTDTNQLNYKKAAAITEANQTDVTDGRQMNGLTVTEDGPNVINVLYTTKTDKKILYLTAASDTFEYDGNAKTLNSVAIEEDGYTASVTTTNGQATLPDGNTIYNANSVVKQTLPGKYENNFKNSDGSEPEVVIKDTNKSEITNSYDIHYTKGYLTITYTPTSETYTYDYGVSNQYRDVLNDVEKAATISIPEEYKDTVVLDTVNNTITYTPDSVNTGVTVPLTLTYAGDYTVTKNIKFLPESNVMYEENLVGHADGNSWTVAGTADEDRAVTEHADAYGYTNAYADDNGYSNGSALKAAVTQGKFTDAATFTFTGTGFDLISECGTDTGMMLVGVKDKDGDAKRAYLVDTYFCGDETYVTGTGILDYQVPVVRNLELAYGTYTVTVMGYLNAKAGAVNNSSTQTISLASAADETASAAVLSAEEIFREAGMSEYLSAGVEVSFMDDNSVLNGGTGPETTAETKTESTKTSLFSRVRSFFANLTGTQTASLETGENGDSGVYTYIDAFRVYQPLTDETNYAEKEMRTTYYSLYDFVKTSVNDLEDVADEMAVYIEYDGETEIASIADYKNQGPENEVYLTPDTAIAFALDGYQKGNTVQVSAKAVTEGAILDTDALPATEMYYDVEVTEDKEFAYVVISNVGNGVLSLSGLKVSGNITIVKAEDEIIQKLNDKTQQFVPENLTVTAPGSAKIGRSFAIRIEASAKDVAKVTVTADGTETELTASNTKAVAKGKASNYKYSYLCKQSTAGTYTYTVTAYDSNGNASAPVTVTVEVK